VLPQQTTRVRYLLLRSHGGGQAAEAAAARTPSGDISILTGATGANGIGAATGPRPRSATPPLAAHLKPLSQHVIVITGASSGIGLATAQMAAERGAAVVLAARHEEALRRLAEGWPAPWRRA
jgi:NADPH:quinone reductase-like Zn-dependent oxidoreductase